MDAKFYMNILFLITDQFNTENTKPNLSVMLQYDYPWTVTSVKAQAVSVSSRGTISFFHEYTDKINNSWATIYWATPWLQTLIQYDIK